MRERYSPDVWEVTSKELEEARMRWMRASWSAIIRCAEADGAGIKKFIERADTTQRAIVAKTAVEDYCAGLGLEELDLNTFFGVTNAGVAGSGFNHEVNRIFEDKLVSAEQYRCPLMDEILEAGYEVGDPLLEDVSLWCDMYDNFESAACAPSVAMTHSHCLGRGDKQCRWFIEDIPKEQRRQEGEGIYEYLSRQRDFYRAKGDGPWVIDGLCPDEIDRITRENVKVTEDQQDELWPTLDGKLEWGVTVSYRIATASILNAGGLLGWDKFVDMMAEKEGPILTKDALKKAKELGIYGFTAVAAFDLYRALRLGSQFEEPVVEEKTADKVVASCKSCPICTAGPEVGLADELKNVSCYCEAVANYQNAALD